MVTNHELTLLFILLVPVATLGDHESCKCVTTHYVTRGSKFQDFFSSRFFSNSFPYSKHTYTLKQTPPLPTIKNKGKTK